MKKLEKKLKLEMIVVAKDLGLKIVKLIVHVFDNYTLTRYPIFLNHQIKHLKLFVCKAKCKQIASF